MWEVLVLVNATKKTNSLENCGSGYRALVVGLRPARMPSADQSMLARTAVVSDWRLSRSGIVSTCGKPQTMRH